MARTDNLTNYLTDVAQAIKDKKGDQTVIKASEFDTEIANLPTSGRENIQDYISSTAIKNDTSTINNIGGQLIYRIKKLPELDLTNINNDKVLYFLFNKLEQLISIPIIKINEQISEIILSNTCDECLSLTDISNLIKVIKEKKIKSMSSTFKYCKNLNDFSFMSELNTNECTNLSNTFYSCNNMETIPLFDTSNVTAMDGTFYYCNNLKEVPLFDTSNVITMSGMFYRCEKLTTIPLFNTSKVNNFYDIFNGIYGLKSLPKLDFSSATNISNILIGNKPNLTELGGFQNLGFMYTQKTENYSSYKLDLSYCPALTHDSVLNVFNSLADLNNTYAEQLYTQQIVLHPTVDALLSDEDRAIATNKG